MTEERYCLHCKNCARQFDCDTFELMWMKCKIYPEMKNPNECENYTPYGSHCFFAQNGSD